VTLTPALKLGLTFHNVWHTLDDTSKAELRLLVDKITCAAVDMARWWRPCAMYGSRRASHREQWHCMAKKAPPPAAAAAAAREANSTTRGCEKQILSGREMPCHVAAQ
jgi:hypothetical protein